MNNVSGWVCPKCGFVWSSMVPGCGNCNKLKENIDLPTIPTIETSRYDILIEKYLRG